MKNSLYCLGILLALACNPEQEKSDAYGNFEATEITVSAEGQGKILYLQVEEGQSLTANTTVGLIDTTQLYLQKEKLKASITALRQKTQSIGTQLEVYLERNKNLTRERKRLEALLKDDAAATKQLDDIKGEIDVVEKQKKALEASLSTQNRGLLAEILPLQKQIDILNDQIQKCLVKAPIQGKVLVKYAEHGEVAMPGRPLFKMADLQEMTLRAYISGSQLTEVQTGQKVEVLVDKNAQDFERMEGTVAWIADEAEFTPKIIQTKEERVNLVYAIKVKVTNRGSIKIGMPGEVRFQGTGQ
ncbi:HlyD family efflux transporter periplasmic adaptor subunit [Rapidithrix thailandica]|uniref:HlyD family efflux transporter periplasmic adaptor subunit n=1 Tax=Rapidithrix thailandica TaxID=413964 RepID=A0AAW9SFP0_9BACT